MDAEESAVRGAEGRAFPAEGPACTKPRGRDHFSVLRKQDSSKACLHEGEILRDHIREIGGASFTKKPCVCVCVCVCELISHV